MSDSRIREEELAIDGISKDRSRRHVTWGSLPGGYFAAKEFSSEDILYATALP